MNDWKLVNGNPLAGLKRVGILQEYGTPFLSLYYDTKGKLLYLSISAYQRKEFNSSLFFQINREDVLQYLNKTLKLSTWMQMYRIGKCYLRKTYRDKNTEWLYADMIPNELINDNDCGDVFDECFCYEQSRIRRFLMSEQYEVKEINVLAV